MIGPFAKVVGACIAAQFHRSIIQHLWQQHRLPLCHQFIEQVAGIHLIRQGVIGQDDPGFTEQRAQALKDRKRQLRQLLGRELSLLL